MLKWFANPGASAKAIWAFLMALQPFLLSIGVDLSGIAPFLNEAWLAAVLLALAPLGVWLFKNSENPDTTTSTVSAARRVPAFLLAIALGASLTACAGLIPKPNTTEETAFVTRTVYDATVYNAISEYSKLTDCDDAAEDTLCSEDDVVVALDKANKSAIAAYDALEFVVRNHHEVDASAAFTAVDQAVIAVKKILATYKIGGF